MNLKKRLAALEDKLRVGDIVLHFADGSQRMIRLHRRESILGLFNRVVSDPHCADADAIRQSVGSTEPGASHMIELAKALLVCDDPSDLDIEEKEMENGK